ncbi:MAG: substrate-binding domain-containing protein [Desulforhopalus sp.]
MKKHSLITALFTSLFIIAFCSSALPVWSQTGIKQNHPKKLTIAGSGVNLGITRLLAEGFVKNHPDIKIIIPGSIGTKGAIAAIVDGAINLGLVSQPLKEEEKAQGIVVLPYAQVAIVIGTHPTVPDQNMTSKDLVEIFKGTKTRWKNGREIIVQAREKSDSGFLVLQKNIPGFREVYLESLKDKRWTLYFTDQDANQALATTPYAFGVTDLGMIATEHLPIKILKLNGIEPSSKNVLNATYPLSRQLSFIYREENLPEEARKFLIFVFSDEGSNILKSNGYITVQQQD